MTLGHQQVERRPSFGHDSVTDSMTNKQDRFGDWLAKELEVARRRGRVTVGAAAAAEVLAREAGGGVGLCLLAPGGGRGLAHLQLVLIEAFCREALIPTLKVDSEEALAAIVGAVSAPIVLLHGDRPLRHVPRTATLPQPP